MTHEGERSTALKLNGCVDSLQSLYRRISLSNGNAIVCPPVRGYNPRALARGLSPVQADKSCDNYFIPPLPMQTLITFEIFIAKVCNF